MAAIKYLFTVMIIVFAGACSIVPPKITLTGDKTVIERQITGDYQELESDAWVVSSVKTMPSESAGNQDLFAADDQLMKAINTRKFHSSRIAAYKKEGAAGEAYTGLLVYRTLSSYENSPKEKKILLAVIENENRARREIFTRSLYLQNKKTPSEQEILAFGRNFAAGQRSSAVPGEWIQNENGKWSQK